MYTALILLLVALSVWVFITGVRKKNRSRIGLAVGLGAITFLFFWFMDFWGEMLWFKSSGFLQRFWIFELNRYAFILGGLIFGFLVVYFTSFSLKANKKAFRLWASLAGALTGGLWGSANWINYLKFTNRIDSGISEPIFLNDAGFYLFTLPFLDSIYALLVFLLAISIIVNVVGTFTIEKSGENLKVTRIKDGDEATRVPGHLSLYISAGLFLLVLAYMKYLDRFHLLYSNYGVVSGPGWTDVHIRLPALMIVVIITAIAGLMLMIPWTHRLAGKMTGRLIKRKGNRTISNIIITYIYTFAIWFLALTVIPGLFQWLKVEPNELRLEEKYISYNIELTQKAFALDRIEEREFPASEVFTKEGYEQNQNIFNNIRLWDYRALDAVYKQFQEIRLYYEFADVDVDRYYIDGQYRQMMVSAREMETDNLPQQSKTFVNKRFKYTHGYGITLTNVSEFTENGLPDLLIKDIPPVSRYNSLKVDQPRLYYGELTREHVIANSKEEEFDYPRGEKNVYFSYNGSGGVAISNFWRKLIYGWKFDGTRLLFSGYPDEESRILFHRQVKDRIKTIAPFLKLDDDPYIALIDGELYWILDTYTTSSYFPYSEHFDSKEDIRHQQSGQTGVIGQGAGWKLHGKNYIRNSVKAVINAYSGEVSLYIFDKDDPVIQVWSNILPGVFKDKEEMPEGIMQHVRYPSDFLLVQGLVYAKYHMTEPTVFYNQEDLWIRATEKYYGTVQPVEPYYVMWEPPETDEQEFILMMPFTPKNRQVAIGWIAGMCDMENYGRFLAYKFPKEKRILGPQQVETKIDQDRFLSGQLTLWDQRGSNVIRGNVLAIPVDNTIIYVEPIYLKAETAAYPELRLVAVMHNDRLSYAETFDRAIEGLFEGTKRETIGGEAPEVMPGTIKELIQRAGTAFDEYIEYTGKKEFNKASESLRELEESLDQLYKQHGEKEREK
jgi:hypothetical protein